MDVFARIINRRLAGVERSSAAAAWVAFMLLAAALLTAGCGSSGPVLSSSGPARGNSAKVTGVVYGGQQPVAGAEIQFYVAGSSGYGAGAKALASAVYTDSNGNFAISSSYTCPSANAVTYLIAIGGDPGVGANNPAIMLMAVLGPCGSLDSLSSIVINEVTTVGAAWALAPFLGPAGEVGTSAGNAQGLLNAAANVNNLVDVSTGAAPGPLAPAGAVLPIAKINTLADILAACVNTSGAGACQSLFAAATPSSGTAPANTLDAAVDIASNPANSIAALYAIPSATAPFQPSLGAAPADWMLAVSYTGAGLENPTSIAIDAVGNVWAANYHSSESPSWVAELSATGAPLSPAGGFTGGGLNQSYGLAVSGSGGVWVTDEVSPGVNGGHGSLTVLNPSGKIVSGTGGYYNGGVYFPVAIAGDTDGSVWTANYGNSTASHLSAGGSAISSNSGYGASDLEGPVAVAVDAGHTAWFADQDNNSVTSISSSGNQIKTYSCCGDGPSGIATDAQAASGVTGHVWTANFYGNSVSELAFQSDGTVAVVSAGYTGGGLTRPNGIAVDGLGNVWVANYHGNSITELQGAAGITPGKPVCSSEGFGSDANLVEPYGIAIDAGGNVWVSNFGSATVTQFVGAAAPVKTPLLGPAQLP